MSMVFRVGRGGGVQVQQREVIRLQTVTDGEGWGSSMEEGKMDRSRENCLNK